MPRKRPSPKRASGSRKPYHLTPSMGRGIPPRFFEMSEYDFQDFCCELFEPEPGIASCEVYGKRGEAQKGVDLFARTSGGAIEVGQCKCTHRFPPAEIRKATSVFFAHWDFWAGQQVRR